MPLKTDISVPNLLAVIVHKFEHGNTKRNGEAGDRLSDRCSSASQLLSLLFPHSRNVVALVPRVSGYMIPYHSIRFNGVILQDRLVSAFFLILLDGGLFEGGGAYTRGGLIESMLTLRKIIKRPRLF